MGGCFAQNAAGAVVDTYWHAHSVPPTITHVFSTPLQMVSAVAFEYRAFGRLENVSNIDSSQSGQVLFWGTWNQNFDYNTFILGCKDGAYANMQMPPLYNRPLSIPTSQPLAWEEFNYHDKRMTLECPAGYAEDDLSDIKFFAPQNLFFYSRLSGKYSKADVCAYSGYSAEAGWRFNIQPMRSVTGGAAFYDVDNTELIEQ